MLRPGPAAQGPDTRPRRAAARRCRLGHSAGRTAGSAASGPGVHIGGGRPGRGGRAADGSRRARPARASVRRVPRADEARRSSRSASASNTSSGSAQPWLAPASAPWPRGGDGVAHGWVMPISGRRRRAQRRRHQPEAERRARPGPYSHAARSPGAARPGPRSRRWGGADAAEQQVALVGGPRGAAPGRGGGAARPCEQQAARARRRRRPHAWQPRERCVEGCGVSRKEPRSHQPSGHCLGAAGRGRGRGGPCRRAVGGSSSATAVVERR